MATIIDTQSITGEIVLSERVTTNEFVIREIHENIQNRRVQVEIELGPFVTEEFPNGETQTRGSSRRGITAWENEAYDAVRDTWRNEDLMVRVSEILNG
jgi:hypothetical protein